MADEPDFTEITIRHQTSGELRTVAKHAFDAGFWPEYGRVDTQGRRVGGSSTPSNKES